MSLKIIYVHVHLVLFSCVVNDLNLKTVKMLAVESGKRFELQCVREKQNTICALND